MGSYLDIARSVQSKVNAPTTCKINYEINEITPIKDNSHQIAKLPADEINEINELSQHDETRIRAWLAHIDETDPELIAETLQRCKTDADVLRYFLWRSEEVPNSNQSEAAP